MAINYRKQSKKAVPVLSVAYLHRQVTGEKTDKFNKYLKQTTKATLRRDLINTTTELIASAKAKKIRTTGLTRIKNDLLNKKYNLKDSLVYDDLVKKIYKNARYLTTVDAANKAQLFTEGVYTTKTGKVRKTRKNPSKNYAVENFEPNHVTKGMIKQGQLQLRQVISNVLMTQGLWERIMSGHPAIGELEFLDQYELEMIYERNRYVPHVDLLDVMFDYYEINYNAMIAENLVASALTMEICRILQSGGRVNPEGGGKIFLPAPYQRLNRPRKVKDRLKK